MASRPFTLLSLLVGLCDLASAQQVLMGITASGPGPHVATTVVGGVTDFDVLGTAPGFVQSLQAVGADSASATIVTNAAQTTTGCSMGFEHLLSAVAAPFSPVRATATSDVTLQFWSATPEPAMLQVSGSLLATGINLTTGMSVDVGADGIVEWQLQPSAPSHSVALTIGPAVTFVRMKMFSQLDDNGSVQALLNVALTPAHATQTDIVMVGCSVPHHLYTLRAWGGGVEFGLFGAPPPALTVLALGLGVQPFVLPSSAPTPCVILPTPDILFVLPPTALALPLPPSVRPVTFWAQAVPILPTGFEATGVWRIQAN